MTSRSKQIFRIETTKLLLLAGRQNHVIPCVECPYMDPIKDFSSPPAPFENTVHTEYASSIYILLIIGI